MVLPPDYQLGDPFFSQDFRVTKSFTYKERYQLKVFSEFFNAFNIANLTGYSFALDERLRTLQHRLIRSGSRRKGRHRVSCRAARERFKSAQDSHSDMGCVAGAIVHANTS